MLLFVLSCSVLALLVVVSLGLSIRRRSDVEDLHLQTELSRRQLNVVIARERLAGLGTAAGDDEARLELESSLADDLGQDVMGRSQIRPDRQGRTSATLLLVAVPLVAVLLYYQLGDTTWVRQAGLPTPEQIRNDPESSLALLLARLEQTLLQEPENPAGWALAGRTYLSLGRYQDAADALAEANRLKPDNPELLTAWADATLLVNENRFSDDVEARVLRALELDPDHVNALWIAGMGLLSRQQNQQGLIYLNRLRPLLSSQPEVQQQIDVIIARASGAPLTDDSPAAVTSISVKVSIESALRAGLEDDQVVFVFARAPAGPRFPLAAARLTVGELPTTVVLDESSAMIEGQTIAAFDQVEVVARVSSSGQPIAEPGDLTSAPMRVNPQDRASISLSIDQLVE